MRSGQSQVQQIHAVTGRLFPEELWSQSELSELVTQTESCQPLSLSIRSIPVFPSHDIPDPRYSHPSYQAFHSPPSHPHRKLNFILGFEGTLISLVTESDHISMSTVTTSLQIKANVSHIVTISIQGQTLIVAVRPGVSEFLNRIRSVSELYLISKLSQKVVMMTLKALGWEEMFKDVYCQADVKRIDACFPRLMDKGEKMMTLGFDDHVSSWLNTDLPYIIPSKRYWPFERHILKSTTLTYDIDQHTTHRETLLPDIYSLYEVEPGSNQLQAVANRLTSVSEHLHRINYKSDARLVFFARRNSDERLFVQITDLNRKLDTFALIQAMGKFRVNFLSHADVLVVEETGAKQLLKIPVKSYRELVEDYFCVELR